MNLLLDTHVFLWYITDDDQLPSAYRESIEATQHGLTVLTVDEIFKSYEVSLL